MRNKLAIIKIKILEAIKRKLDGIYRLAESRQIKILEGILRQERKRQRIKP